MLVRMRIAIIWAVCLHFRSSCFQLPNKDTDYDLQPGCSTSDDSSPCLNRAKSALIDPKDPGFTVVRLFQRPKPLYYTYSRIELPNIAIFRQGLLFTEPNVLLESAGLYGKSVIHYVDMESGAVTNERKIEKQYFAEGCDLIQLPNKSQRIYQLTWKEGTMYAQFHYSDDKCVALNTIRT